MEVPRFTFIETGKHMKLIPLVIALTVSAAVTAKTTTLVCETKPLTTSGQKRSIANQTTSQAGSQSIWHVAVESDQSGKVTGVRVDDVGTQFIQNGASLKFKGNFVSNLEINIQTGQARTTLTGYDTLEQGTCKEVSVAETTPIPIQVLSSEPKALLISEIQFANMEKRREYTSRVPSTLSAFGGVVIARGGNSAAGNDSKSDRSIAVIQFPSRAKALQWYESTDHQKILKNADTGSTHQIYSVDE
jgi:uncharacterized protein (DUF1330 family)